MSFDFSIFSFGRRKRRKNLAYYLLLFTVFFTIIGILPVVAQNIPSQSVLQTLASPIQLVQEGKDFYTQGNYHGAIKKLQEAKNIFRVRGDKLNLSMTLSNLSLAYQQLGLWDKAEDEITESIKLLKSLTGNSKDKLKLLASALEVRGKLKLSIGKPGEALENWQGTANTFNQIGDKNGEIRSQVNQSLALQELGLYRETLKILIPLFKEIKEQNNSYEKAIIFRRLGNILRVAGLAGDLEERKTIITYLKKDDDIQKYSNYLDISREFLLKSCEILKKLQLQQDIAETYLALGNTERAAYYRMRDAYERVSSSNNNLNKQILLQINATKYYQKAANKSILDITKIQAKLNHFALLIDFKNYYSHTNYANNEDSSKKELEDFKKEIDLQILVKLPKLSKIQLKVNSHSAIYARINLAQSLMKLYEMGDFSDTFLIKKLLKESEKQAVSQGNKRGITYALGKLGEFYEKTEDWRNAKYLTEEALKLAEEIQAPDITYQWQWQLGRILKAEKNPQRNYQGAIAAYKEAANTLNLLRQDLRSLQNPDLLFSFRDSVEPVYRDLFGLLLPPNSNTTDGIIITNKSANKNDISSVFENEAIQFFEKLQVLELENFLRCRLQEASSVPINQSISNNLNDDTAIIYPIILNNPNRLEVLLKFPNKEKLPEQQKLIRRTTYNVSQSQIENAILNLRKSIEQGKTAIQDEDEGRKFQILYDYIFGKRDDPNNLDKEIKNNNIKTLVFVLDSPLKNIPLAALYDGKNYLIEKTYSIALNVVPKIVESKPLSEQKIEVLAAGISINNLVKNIDPEFPNRKTEIIEAPYIGSQMKFIKELFPTSKILCNDGIIPSPKPNEPDFHCDAPFEPKTLEEAIKSQPFKIVHIATHGTFSSSPDDTYILAYKERINVDQLSELIRSREENRFEPIELLIFSACQTASGDKRAVLGIAGISIRVGARSTVASLYIVNDNSTSLLIKKFYKELPKLTKAEALHRAQLHLFRKRGYDKPKYWASYVLVGDWR